MLSLTFQFLLEQSLFRLFFTVVCKFVSTSLTYNYLYDFNFPGESRTGAALELARQAHDRVSLLEHGHTRLSNEVDSRFAASSEFDDWVTNRAEEDWLEISGYIFILAFLSNTITTFFVPAQP